MGIDIKDIPKIDDKEFSITLNAFFVVRWMDRRMSINQEKLQSLFKQGTFSFTITSDHSFNAYEI